MEQLPDMSGVAGAITVGMPERKQPTITGIERINTNF